LLIKFTKSYVVTVLPTADQRNWSPLQLNCPAESYTLSCGWRGAGHLGLSDESRSPQERRLGSVILVVEQWDHFRLALFGCPGDLTALAGAEVNSKPGRERPPIWFLDRRIACISAPSGSFLRYCMFHSRRPLLYAVVQDLADRQNVESILLGDG